MRFCVRDQLVSQLVELLCQISVVVEGDQKTCVVRVISAVPQGDLISALMFDIFMDSLLERMQNLSGVVASCFEDDVILLNKAQEHLRAMLQKSDK